MPRIASQRPHIPADRRRRRGARVALEALEGRLLLFATNGGAWVHPERITFSFAPDGTNVGGLSSNLNAAMAARGFAPDAWKNAVRDAAGLWEQVAGVNLVEVPDGGDPFSVPGYQQGDPRFGDIRIAGVNLGPGSLGLDFLPPPINGGTLAGDMVLNTAMPWSLAGDYNLETVAIHEFGHALGLDHSGLYSAVMYAYYTGVKTILASDDVAGVQAVYGAPRADAFEAGAGNQTYPTATPLNPYLNPASQISLGGLSIHTLPGGGQDQDWYVVTVPKANNHAMTVTVQSTNLSELAPRVMVYNAALQGVAQAMAPYAYGATISTGVTGVTEGQMFYIRVLPANGGSTGIGAYGLQVNFSGQAMGPIQPPDTRVASQADHGGGSAGLGLGLGASLAGPGAGVGLGLGLGLGLGAGKGLPVANTPASLVGNLPDGRLQLGTLVGQGDELTLASLQRPPVPAPGPGHATGPGRATGAGVPTLGLLAPEFAPTGFGPAPRGAGRHFARHRKG
jgi:hypothetical protein